MTDEDLIERLVSALSVHGADHSCVKLSRNAKGETQIEVSVRTDDAEILTADDASVKAQYVYDALSAKYPPLHPVFEPAPQPKPAKTRKKKPQAK